MNSSDLAFWAGITNSSIWAASSHLWGWLFAGAWLAFAVLVRVVQWWAK